MTPKRFVGLAIVIVSMTVALSGPAQTATSNALVYSLGQGSDFEWGCFEPCMCPVLVRQPVLGTFELTRVGSDLLFDNYAVTNVRWRLTDSATPVTIVGSGKYRRGGEFAVEEQLALDLSFDGGDPQHFDSGLVTPGAPFPAIQTKISLHGIYCFDSVLTVVAKPLGTAEVGAASALQSVVVTPSPFIGSTTVEFSLPHDGNVDLEVLDVTGRELRSLARGEWFTAGRHRITWDGLLANGGVAPPGLYFIRLGRTGGRAVVKLR